MDNQDTPCLSDSELIKLLEKEMSGDVNDFDIPPAEEHLIDIQNVCDWYLSAEKLIRVLGNTFSSPTVQSINQLRYAGHHILKAQISKDDYQSNLVEAFKHCKRAVYDAYDFYIYQLNEYYRSLMPYLTSDRALELERLIRDLIIEITECRDQSKTRINYYSGVQKTFIKGIEIIQELNTMQREAGISDSILISRRQLAMENSRLEKERIDLVAENKKYKQIMGDKGNRLGIALTVAVALMALIGTTISAWVSSDYNLTFSNPVTISSPPSEIKAIGSPSPD